MLNRIDAAIADFTTVLLLEPNHAKAAYSRALCNNKAERFDDANGGWGHGKCGGREAGAGFGRTATCLACGWLSAWGLVGCN